MEKLIKQWLADRPGNFYITGDRVKIGGITGDVIDIGVLRTALIECGDRVKADLPIGRLVRVPTAWSFGIRSSTIPWTFLFYGTK
jgi:hypothetical protein